MTGMMSKIKKTNEICRIEIKVKEWIKGAEDKEYQVNCRYLNIDQRLCNKTNNLNENSHLLVCGELTIDSDSQIVVDILDINYLPGYQQKTLVKSTAQSPTTYNWGNSEENYRRSISKIIDKKIIILDNNEENLVLDNNNKDSNKNDITVETKGNNNNSDNDEIIIATKIEPIKNNKRKSNNKASNTNARKKIITRSKKIEDEYDEFY
jgi:hypothetical protein